MSLREEIKPFIDGNGLVSPCLYTGETKQGSDNGLMFSAEFYIMLQKLGELNEQDRENFYDKVLECWSNAKPGLLNRAPGDYSQDGPDNYYAVLAAAKVLELEGIAHDILYYGRTHCGVFNNTNSTEVCEVNWKLLYFDKENWKAFLWRQPQLKYAALCAAGEKGPWYLELYTALVIATSCMFTDKNSTDERRLSWLLIQTVKDDSWLCKLASKLWYKRLYKDYPDGMKGVARIYYQNGHPFQNYWCD